MYYLDYYILSNVSEQQSSQFHYVISQIIKSVPSHK